MLLSIFLVIWLMFYSEKQLSTSSKLWRSKLNLLNTFTFLFSICETPVFLITSKKPSAGCESLDQLTTFFRFGIFTFELFSRRHTFDLRMFFSDSIRRRDHPRRRERHRVVRSQEHLDNAAAIFDAGKNCELPPS